jgi:hypothetical protein
MRFVSTYSLNEASRGYPRILEFTVIPGDKGEGVRLVVNEFVYTGPLSAGMSCAGVQPGPVGPQIIFKPVQISNASFVLADRLASCQFAFKMHRELPSARRLAPALADGRNSSRTPSASTWRP